MPRRSERTPPAPPRPARVAAFRRGLAAERRAAALLAAQGLRIVTQRWRSPAGEIDIVARGDRLLVFAEVKARASAEAAAWSLTPRQRARIIAGAQAWLAEHPEDGECYVRFDVVLIAPGGAPTHLPNAFDASP